MYNREHTVITVLSYKLHMWLALVVPTCDPDFRSYPQYLVGLIGYSELPPEIRESEFTKQLPGPMGRADQPRRKPPVHGTRRCLQV